ncbi:MAG: flavin reductase family protein [Actinomycetota bacterium]|nr:flavin reductase family protein [Actinomycetota bacterium]
MTVDLTLSPVEMRRVLGQFCSGVTVVTGMTGDVPVGFSCQSFASVSLEPPLVLFCPAHTSRSWPLIRDSGAFCVNVLAEDQQHVCAAFASSGGDKFEGVAWRTSPCGPTLEGVLATVHCDIEAVHQAGDHDVVIGRVRQLVTHRDAGPLVFFKGQFGLGSPWA